MNQEKNIQYFLTHPTPSHRKENPITIIHSYRPTLKPPTMLSPSPHLTTIKPHHEKEPVSVNETRRHAATTSDGLSW